MSKVIGRFEPTPERSPEECERHYVAAHVPFAQNQLRPMPTLESYHVNRATAQADVAGGFAQRPRAWRFVVLRFEPGSTLAFDAHQLAVVSQDHTNCLYRLRSFEVEETVAFDRRSGQLAMAKFVVEAERSPSTDPAAARSAFGSLAERVAATMAGAFGARLLLVNHVASEAATEPVAVEGQRIVGLLPETTMVGFLECYFDHRRWGSEALGPMAAAGGLWQADLLPPGLYAVEEEAALDMAGMR